MPTHEVVIDGVIYVPKQPVIPTVERATVRIPGHVTCLAYPQLGGGWLVGKMEFIPYGSDAGWRGSIAELEHVLADGADADDELAAAVDVDLSVNDTDGAFWEALRDNLAHGNRITWGVE